MGEPAVENPPESTGGVTGKGFEPGKTGNPGGRPRGLAKAVRELVGSDGLVIAQVMAQILADTSAAKRDRIAAGAWLADRGWGKAPTFAPVEDDDPLELSERAANVIAGEFNDELDRLRKRRSQQQ